MAAEPVTPLPPLTEDQKGRIHTFIKENPEASLTQITAHAYQDESADSRSREGRLVKQYLLENNLEYKSKSVFQRERIVLTDAQKEFIKNNYKNQTYTEVARTLFENDKLIHVSLECRVVNDYIQELQDQDPEINKLDTRTYVATDRGEDSVSNIYYPPRRTDQTVFRINKYLNLGWSADNLKASQQKQVDMLQRYLSIFSFCYQISTYKTNNDRNLFEDSFIRYTYDKPDLSQEELDQFIVLCTEVVTAATILQQVEELRELLRDSTNNEADGRNIKMQLNEAISNLQTEYNQCRARQQKLYKSLVDDRSKRIALRQEENATILNLVQAWKDAERRKGILILANAQKQNLKDEAKNLSSMDELKAIIRGINVDEMVNG